MKIGEKIAGEFFSPVRGIYKITNTKNGRVYIGQSSGVQQRIAEHFKSLRNDKHSNRGLQADWNRWGYSVFVVEFIEEVFNEQFRLCREIEIIREHVDSGIEVYNGASSSIRRVTNVKVG